MQKQRVLPKWPRRFHALLAACALLALGTYPWTNVWASVLPANPEAVQQHQPWQAVHLPSSLAVPLRDSVIEIFEYGCPYCRKLNSTLRHWGSSLPASVSFSQIPALIGKPYIPMTLATFAVETIAPSRLGLFERNSFQIIQGQGKPINDVDAYLAAAAQSGISPKALAQAVHQPRVMDMARNDLTLMRILHLRHTPSLLICGRYLIDPGNVGGNYSLFIQLANGLVSQCLQTQ